MQGVRPALARVQLTVRPKRNRAASSLALALIAAALLAVFAVRLTAGFWRLRLGLGRLLARLPERAPDHIRVLPPPAEEYVGTLPWSPAEARERLPRVGFSQQVRAYFHAYDRDGEAVHEVGSFVRRPDGFTGDYQLHVRLFPAPDGGTEVWAHWERNPYVAPLAHLRMDGYDPAEGERRVRELLDEPE